MLNRPAPARSLPPQRSKLAAFDGTLQPPCRRICAPIYVTAQRVGVNWLAFLRDRVLGALQADDMGLGKTRRPSASSNSSVDRRAANQRAAQTAEETQRFRPALRQHLSWPSRQIRPPM
ncbi:MAG: hypothetical protein R3C68_13940 [Myxococcota bacterium]